MLVKDVMNTDVKTIDKDSTVQEAAEIMNKFGIGSLIVIKGEDNMVGIVTERDMMSKIVAKAKDSSKTRVSEIMTKKVIMVSPNSDIEDAVHIMLDKKIKKLPVLENNKLIGIVTSVDLCSAQPKLIEQVGSLLLFSKKKKAVAG